MGLSLGNPWGLLALLGIPAILAIHLLQRRARIIPVSTLFLLEQLQRESQGGRRVEKLRASVPLWLQLLAVLVLSWILAGPRWLEKNSVQRIAVVLDGSASMRAAKAAVLETLPRDIRRLASATAQTEMFLLDTRRGAEHLYHGPEGSGFTEALKAWDPTAGSHDPSPALRLARNLAGRDGMVILVTDSEIQDLPPGVQLHASGQPIDNVGIAGIAVEEADGKTIWRATLRNYSKTAQTRTWRIESGGKKSAEESLSLEPGQVRQIQAPFAEGMEELTVSLSPDKFDLDDRAPVLKPRPKKVKVSLPASEAAVSAETGPLYTPIFRSLPGVELAAAEADVTVAAYNPLSPALPAGPAVIFVQDPKPSSPVLNGALLVEKDPLVNELNWHSLLCQDGIRLPLRPEDEALVWQGERALLFLRDTGAGTGGGRRDQQLVFNFDLRKSNARRLPAFVIAIHRYLDQVRRRLPREEWTLSECGQKLETAAAEGENAAPLTIRMEGQADRTLPAAQAPLLRAPELPGFMEVRQGDRLLLRTAAHFADIREADFTTRGTKRDLSAATAEVTQRHSREDPAWRAWLLVLLGLLGLSWWFISRPERRQSPLSPARPRSV
ncbi:MAG: BatA domain-containing protein [Verrucomicrobiota bacterium]